MGLAEKLSALRKSAERQLDVLNSKEKTENALLLPFFDALGYDAFNVREVEPGHVVELEEGAKDVDYAVKIDGAPTMLFQCEEAATDLDAFDGDPLFRHFDALDASLVVLTNGLTYRFFADLGGEGAVDGRPFFEFDLLNHESEQISYLERLTKSAFDTDEVLSTAFELKYTRLLQNYLVRQRDEPDTHFVRFLAAQIHEGEVSEGILDQFQPVVQQFLQQFDMEKRTVQPQPMGDEDGTDQTTAQTTTPHQAEKTESPTETSPPEEPGPSKEASSSSEEGGDVETRTQEVPSGQSENGESHTTAASSSNGEPETEGGENGELEQEESDDELQGGSSIAKEFANKVVGDS